MLQFADLYEVSTALDIRTVHFYRLESIVQVRIRCFLISPSPKLNEFVNRMFALSYHKKSILLYRVTVCGNLDRKGLLKIKIYRF